MPVALAGFGLGILAFGLIFGYRALAQFIQALFGRAGGVIGNWVSSVVTDAADSIGSWVEGAFAAVISPVASFISYLTGLWEDVWSRSVTTVAHGIEAIEAIASVSLPKLQDWIHTSVSATDAALSGTVTALSNDIGRLATDEASDIATVRKDVADVGAQSVADAQAFVDEAVSAIDTSMVNLRNGLESDISSATAALWSTASAAITASQGEVISDLRAAEGNLSAAIGTAAASAVADAEAYVDQAIKAIGGGIDDVVTQTMAGLWGDVAGAAETAATEAEGMAGALPGMLADVPSVSPLGAAAAIGALAHAMAASLTATADCTIPNCRNLKGFGNELSNLLGDITDGGLIALFVGLATDPSGTASAVQGPLTDMVDPVIGDVQTLVGTP